MLVPHFFGFLLLAVYLQNVRSMTGSASSSTPAGLAEPQKSSGLFAPADPADPFDPLKPIRSPDLFGPFEAPESFGLYDTYGSYEPFLIPGPTVPSPPLAPTVIPGPSVVHSPPGFSESSGSSAPPLLHLPPGFPGPSGPPVLPGPSVHRGFPGRTVPPGPINLDVARTFIHETAINDPCRRLEYFKEGTFSDVQTSADQTCLTALNHFLTLPEREQSSCPNARQPAICRKGLVPKGNIPKCSFECDVMVAKTRKRPGHQGIREATYEVVTGVKSIKDVSHTVDHPAVSAVEELDTSAGGYTIVRGKRGPGSRGGKVRAPTGRPRGRPRSKP